MDEIAVSIDALSKRYRIGVKEERQDTLVGALMAWARAPIDNYRRLRSLSEFEETGGDPDDVIWALRDISFDVNRGEVVGIIGRNGAGKSTLLKILSRITDPTAGRVRLDGRVASLLEVGTGFHPELTGRENVYLNGTILGMSKAEIDRKFDEIVDFSGVGRFLDTPIKRYSSGMKVRLAFAVAAHLDPEILLIDEVLAVGDAAFQRKCVGKMDEVARGGRTVLFVSHQMAAVESLCPRTVWLDDGRVMMDGPTVETLNGYLDATDAITRQQLFNREDRKGNGAIRFGGIDLRDGTGRPVRALRSGSDAVLAVKFVNTTETDARDVHLGIGIDAWNGQRIAHLSTEALGLSFERIGPGEGEWRIEFDRLALAPGRFRLTLFARVAGEIADWVQDAGSFEVEAGDFYETGRLPTGSQGHFLLDYRIQLEQGGVPAG